MELIIASLILTLPFYISLWKIGAICGGRTCKQYSRDTAATTASTACNGPEKRAEDLIFITSFAAYFIGKICPITNIEETMVAINNDPNIASALNFVLDYVDISVIREIYAKNKKPLHVSHDVDNNDDELEMLAKLK